MRRKEFVIKVTLTIIAVHIGLFGLLGCGKEDKEKGPDILWMKSEVVLPTLLSDNAILQQNSKVLLWGKTDPKVSVKIFTSWDNKEVATVADSEGNFTEQVQTPAAGGPFHIIFDSGKEKRLNNIMIGEVWLCSGQSNMNKSLAGSADEPILNSEELINNSKNSQIRIYAVDRKMADLPETESGGSWFESEPEVARKTSALAYQFAQQLHEKLNIPVGIITSAWGGTPIRSWMSAESLKGIEDPTPINPNVPQHTPSVLFNGMIAPLTNYSIRGVLWYQGEDDRFRSELYRQMMPAMVTDWRTKFRDAEMPFYYVQIAPWTYPNDASLGAPYFREMQYELSKVISHSGIAVTADVGSNTTIHPPDKTSVAERLLRIALAKTYGFPQEKYLGPEVKKIEVEGKTVRVHFDHADGGLVLENDETNNFEVAETDGVFRTATARVDGEILEVWSDQVASPSTIRYGFKNYFKGNLFNKAGLPATPFRATK